MKKSFVVLGSVAIVFVGLLATFFIVQNRIDTRSRAEKTVTLSFSPSSATQTPIQVRAGDTFSLDLILTPGSNLVSTAKIHVQYDSTKIQVANGIPFQPNQSAFTELVEGPTFSPGNVSFTLSVGTDFSKAIKTPTRIGTITFKALDYVSTTEGPTLISYANDSQVLSISSNSTPTENVISNVVPATIAISDTNNTPPSPTPTGAPIPNTSESQRTYTVQIPTSICIFSKFFCKPMFVTNVETNSVLKVNYKAHSLTCSSTRVHFYVDGVKKHTSNWLGWNGSPLTSFETGTVDLGPVSSGTHIVGVYAEGRPGGCIIDKFISWRGGSLTITTSSQLLPPPPPTACKVNAPVDAMIVMDTSGSMNDRITSSTRKIAAAKTAANQFVDALSPNTDNRIGLVSYNSPSGSTLKSQLTNNFSGVKSQINNLSASGATCIECGVNKARQEFAARGRQGFKKAVILLTDGRANQIEGGSSRNGDTAIAEQRALTAVTNDFNANKTVYYTIGLGKDVNSDFLQSIANTTGGRYYFSPTGSDLNEIYNQISQIVTKGSVSGVVYSDENNNGNYEQGESRLSSWQVQLLSGSTVIQTVTTDEDGTFNLSGVCGGTYTLKQIAKPGWTQTQPANNGTYTINITNADTIPNKNFGNRSASRCSDIIDNDNNGFADAKDSTCHTDGNPNNPASYDPQKDGERGGNTCADSQDNNENGLVDGADPVCHTGGNPNNPWDPNLPEIAPTSVPTATTAPTVTTAPTATTVPTVPTTPGVNTSLNVDLLLHGIGSGGDNTNPTANNLSNKNPLHPIKTASVSIFDASNNPVTTASGTVTYNSSTGSYKGTLNLGSGLTSGVYTIKVKTEQHLYRLIAGIQTLTAGQTNTVASTDLVAGDVNDDNKLNILDYNSLIDCYSDLSPAVACNPTLKLQTDLNDDDKVNQVDYNLFLREIATQPGQ